MVVRADHEIHSPEALEQIHALTLKHGAVPRPCPGMDGHDHDIRPLPGGHLVHILLHQRHKALERHSAPESLRQPVLHVGVREAEDGDLQTPFPEHLVKREIGLAVIVADSVARQKRDPVRLQFPRHTVVDPVSRLDVVVADGHRIVAHVGGYPRIDVRRERVHIVEVIGRIVSLKDVAGIDEDHIVSPGDGADTVHDRFHGTERRPHPVPDIGGIEIGSMHVIGGEKLDDIVPVPWTGMAPRHQEADGGSYSDKRKSTFHTL